MMPAMEPGSRPPNSEMVRGTRICTVLKGAVLVVAMLASGLLRNRNRWRLRWR
jgi:hypothetical protein